MDFLFLYFFPLAPFLLVFLLNLFLNFFLSMELSSVITTVRSNEFLASLFSFSPLQKKKGGGVVGTVLM